MIAIVIVHWPGQDTPACPEHAGELQALARTLGFPLSMTFAEKDVECANCLNELKRASSAQ